MEILKFKKIPGASLAAILHLQLPLKAIGGEGRGVWTKWVVGQTNLYRVETDIYY